MPALDAIGLLRTTGGGGSDSAFTAVTVAPGDSLTVRSFNPSDFAEILGLNVEAAALPLGVRVRSPLLHDVAEGIQVVPSLLGGSVYLPRQARQRLRPQDTLIAEIKGAGTTAANAGAIFVYYSNLPGAGARLHQKSEIMGLIKNIKVVDVIGGGSSTAGQWYDNLLTLTENLLHANTDYAVLGYIVDAAMAAFAVKGIDTGNLRCAGPGITDANQTSQWFVKLSEDTGLPTIPVINAANAGGTQVSFLSHAANVGANGQLILAELAQNLTS